MRKGKVDLITLAIGMIPMMLFLFIGGYTVIENQVQTDLDVQMDFTKNNFESLMALNHVLKHGDNYRDIHEYAKTGNGKSTIEDNIDQAFRGFPDRREHKVTVTVPEEDNIEKSSSDPGDATYSSNAVIASPREEKVEVEVFIGE